MNTMASFRSLLFAALCALALGTASARDVRVGEIDAAALPKEAHATLALIKSGGPFPYRKDGTVFGNREKRLPLRERGYYREYTVKTPGAPDRGARRIVAGSGERGDVRTSGEYYYTDDHYNSFRRIR
jgi:ribonuclease T1